MNKQASLIVGFVNYLIEEKNQSASIIADKTGISYPQMTRIVNGSVTRITTATMTKLLAVYENELESYKNSETVDEDKLIRTIIDLSNELGRIREKYKILEKKYNDLLK